MSDIKVGDLVSVLASDSPNWICMRIPDEASLNEANEAIASGFTVQHGLHESLIPEGFAIVPTEPTQDMMIHISGESWHESRENYYKLLKAAPKPTDK